MHSETVAPSSLATKEFSKFDFRKSVNELVLGKDYQKTQAFLEIAEKVQLLLKNVDVVVPKQSVEIICHE